MGIQAPIDMDAIRKEHLQEAADRQQKAAVIASAKAQLLKKWDTNNANCFMEVGDDSLINLNQVTKILGNVIYFVDGSKLDTDEEFNVLLENLKSSTYVDVLENSDGN